MFKATFACCARLAFCMVIALLPATVSAQCSCGGCSAGGQDYSAGGYTAGDQNYFEVDSGSGSGCCDGCGETCGRRVGSGRLRSRVRRPRNSGGGCLSGDCGGGFGGCQSGGCNDGGCQSGTCGSGSAFDFGPGQYEGASPCVDSCCRELGPYISLFGGVNGIHELEQEISFPGAMATDPDTDEFRNFSGEAGEAFGIAVGRAVHQRARTELDFTYRDINLDNFRVQQFEDDFLTAQTNTPVTGGVESFSIMGNFLLDLSPRCVGRFNLYGGGGVGALYVNGTANGGGSTFEIDDTAFAWQAIGGLNYAFRARSDLFLEYRFQSSTVTIDDVTAGTGLGSFDFRTNSLFVGVRIRR